MAEAIVTADSAVRPDPIPLTFWPTCSGRSWGAAAQSASRFAV
jgi:hypothetical protein